MHPTEQDVRYQIPMSYDRGATYLASNALLSCVIVDWNSHCTEVVSPSLWSLVHYHPIPDRLRKAPLSLRLDLDSNMQTDLPQDRDSNTYVTLGCCQQCRLRVAADRWRARPNNIRSRTLSKGRMMKEAWGGMQGSDPERRRVLVMH